MESNLRLTLYACIQDQEKCDSHEICVGGTEQKNGVTSTLTSIGCDNVSLEPTKCILEKLHDNFCSLKNCSKPEKQWEHLWTTKVVLVPLINPHSCSSPHLPGRPNTPKLHHEEVSLHEIHCGVQNAAKAKSRRNGACHSPLLVNMKETTALKMNSLQFDKTWGVSPT